MYGGQRWSADVFEVSAGTKIRIMNVPGVCGGNLRSTTSMAMDDQAARLVCTLCATSEHAPTWNAVTWRAAVFHCLHGHRTDVDSEVTWTFMPRDLILEDEVYNDAILGQAYDDEHSWSCTHCNPYDRMLTHLPRNVGTKQQVVAHALHVH